MFSVKRIENGYLFLSDGGSGETYCKNEKALVNTIRFALGMKKVGRPKKEAQEETFNGLDA